MSKKHYYIEQCGRIVSDFDNESDARRYIERYGGDLLISEEDA